MFHNFSLINSSYLHSINAQSFDDIALAAFQYQYHNNTLYRSFTDALHIAPASVRNIQQIPFLPVSFFKTYQVKSGDWQQHRMIFESSGTTGDIPSRHFIYDEHIYRESLLMGFEQFYGPVEQYAIIALLPSYLERGNSSLVHMARVLMEKSAHPANGFYLNEYDKLRQVLQQLEAEQQPTLLLGVTFALLDFAEQHSMHLQHTMVMETGGMKGRREEWTRTQVHDFLKQQWQLSQVHSEYGMTELLSQAYAKADGIFSPAATMRVLVRDINDPLDVSPTGTGCLNIIDLANIHSCCFIATDDIGTIVPDGTFQVLGRIDHAALRGCNLMVI